MWLGGEMTFCTEGGVEFSEEGCDHLQQRREAHAITDNAKHF